MVLKKLLPLTLALGLVGCSDHSQQEDPEVRKAREHLEAFEAHMGDEFKQKTLETQMQVIAVMHGEDFANDWHRCQFDPPKREFNQKRCKRILDQVAREDAAFDAEQKRKHENW